MSLLRSTISSLRDGATALLRARFPHLSPIDAQELERLARMNQQLGAELAGWREWSTRAVLAERWARCAAEHLPGSHWRTLLSAFAVSALLTDDLGELEIQLAERARSAEQFGTDKETGTPCATPEQQVGVVYRAMMEELIAAKKAETRHYYDPISLGEPGVQADLHRTWDREKLASAARDLVSSATKQAIQVAASRLGLTQATSGLS